VESTTPIPATRVSVSDKIKNGVSI
jgi:hypothetical protein